MATDLEKAISIYFPDPNKPLLEGDRLAGVVLRGQALEGEFREAVTKITYEVGTTESSKMEITVEDPEFKYLGTQLFRRRTEVGYLDLNFEIAAREVNGGSAGLGGISLTCYGRGPQKLKRASGARVVRNQSPTTFAGILCAEEGLYFVGEESAIRPQVSRTAEANKAPESSWDTIKRFGEELGYWVFEASNLVIFGRPSWIINQQPTVNLGWSPSGSPDPSWPAGTIMVPSCPAFRDSDNADQPVSVSFQLEPKSGRLLRPGHPILFHGIPDFGIKMIVTNVGGEIAPAALVDVSAETPIDPDPQPPQEEHQEEGGGSTAAGETTNRDKSTNWRWPTEGKQGDGFGAARPKGRKHAGIDIAAKSGTRVVAARSGKVSAVGWDGGYGNRVIVTHSDGLTSLYAHLSRIDAKNGQEVGAGQMIGAVGSTGNSTGPHLHFEIRKGGKAQNPKDYLP